MRKFRSRKALAGMLAAAVVLGGGVAAVTPAGAEVADAAATNWKKIWKKKLRPLADKRYYTKIQSDATYETKAAHDASLAGYYTKAQVDAALGKYYTPTQSDARYRLASASLSVPFDDRFALLYPLTGGTVGRMAIRGDASIRDASDPAATVTKVGTGQYCVSAPNALEGAVGSLQNPGGGTLGTIRVSMGIGSFCNAVAGANITVEIFRAVS